MEPKIPSPFFTGLRADDAAINISFPSGDIHAPEFKFRGLAIDGDGCSYGLYLAALESLKHLIVEQIQREVKRTEGLKVSVQRYPLPEKPETKQQPLEVLAGWQLVPDVATDEWVEKYEPNIHYRSEAATEINAMLAAAPKLEVKK